MGLLIVVVSYYIRNWALMILGGITFLILALYDVFTQLSPAIEVPFFLLAGIVIIYQGIALFVDERKGVESND